MGLILTRTRTFPLLSRGKSCDTSLDIFFFFWFNFNMFFFFLDFNFNSWDPVVGSVYNLGETVFG